MKVILSAKYKAAQQFERRFRGDVWFDIFVSRTRDEKADRQAAENELNTFVNSINTSKTISPMWIGKIVDYEKV